MALVVVVLTSAGLMLNSLVRALTVDLGVRVDQVITVRSRPPRQAWKSAAAVESFYRDVAAHISAMPGVRRVAGVCTLTVGGNYAPWAPMLVDGPPERRGARYLVTADYFRVLGIRVVSGRQFSQQEIDSAALVAIVNETAARRLWPGERAVGKQFKTGSEQSLEVIGVVADTRDSYQSPVRAALYVPPDRRQPVPLDLVVLVDGDLAALAGEIQARAATAGGTANVKSLSDTIHETTTDERFQALLLSLFAALALVLAAVGIAGIVGYTVSRRTREMGIRIALGSTPSGIVSLVIRQSLALVTGGAVVGVCLALGVTRLLTRLLFEVKPNDPATFVAALAALLVVAAIASLLPALRAARVDPIVVLRTE
jgi:putative ABC transport system permease protein